MDRWLLLIATLLAAIGGAWGMLAVHRGVRSRWTLVWMVGVFLCQLGFLSLRGQIRGTCPLQDIVEILVYLSWALTFFYLLIGPAYQISLLGVFTAPVVFVLQSAALVTAPLVAVPERMGGSTLFHATHSATSVLAYGALALASVAGVMFLVLDRQLKDQVLRSGLFRNLPPARDLLISVHRLLWLGMVLLSIGVVAGFLMPRPSILTPHFVAALAVWCGYAGLLAVKTLRGLTGRKLARATVVLFVISLMVFAFV